MKVRSATHADLPIIDEMITEAATEVGQPNTAETVRRLVRHGLNSKQLIPVLESAGGQLVGFCIWVRLPTSVDGRVEGGGTWVAVPYRLQGFGSTMRSVALTHQRMNGGKYVVGTADANDSAACRSVESMGFRPTKIEYQLDIAGVR